MPVLQGKVSLEHTTNRKNIQQGVRDFVYLKFSFLHCMLFSAVNAILVLAHGRRKSINDNFSCDSR